MKVSRVFSCRLYTQCSTNLLQSYKHQTSTFVRRPDPKNDFDDDSGDSGACAGAGAADHVAVGAMMATVKWMTQAGTNRPRTSESGMRFASLGCRA